jgi:PIN domain nuclease of toxin-antitoxin system
VRLLLDTHIAIWALVDDPRLSKRARELLGDSENEIFTSTGTVWEISIKHALRRGGPNDMPISGSEAVGYFKDAGYQLLDIKPAHAIKVEELPDLHSDPFDRILIAQALAEPLNLLTHDPLVGRYSDTIIVV